MIENYIIYNGLPLTAWQGDGKTSWDQLGRNLQPYLEQGHPILAHSYLKENPTPVTAPGVRLPMLRQRADRRAYVVRRM